LLLGEKEREAVLIGSSRPSSATIIAFGGLCAAMEHNDERGALHERFWNVGLCDEAAGIRTKAFKNG
jgi:hypothetical protein